MLATTTVFVAGGAGAVGEGIAEQLLAAGARVVITSRSPDKLAEVADRLRASTDDDDRVVAVAGDLATPVAAATLRDDVLSRVGELDAVVASLGGWWSGSRVVDLDLATWQSVIDRGLTAHFATATAFLPLIAQRDGASYTMINGAGGVSGPVPQSGPVSVSAAGQAMLTKVLAAEHADEPVRINSLVLMTPVITRARPEGRDEWLTAGDAGRYVVHLVSGRGGEDGQEIHFGDRTELEGLAGIAGT